MLVEIPELIFQTLLFVFIVYFGVGFVRTFSTFLKFSLTTVLLGFSATAFGSFISVFFDQAETAVEFSPVIMNPLGAFGGFMVNVGNIPLWIAWLQYMSPVRYGLEAFVYNEFE